MWFIVSVINPLFVYSCVAQWLLLGFSMKIKKFVYSSILFLLLVILPAGAFEYALKYPKGKLLENPISPSYNNIDIALEQFRQSTHNSMIQKNATTLHGILRDIIPQGTCYGQSFTFMLLNPPNVKKLHLPQKNAAQQQVIWFQGQNSTHFFFSNRVNSTKEKGIALLRKMNPGQTIDEKMDLVELNREIGKVEPTAALLPDLADYTEHLVEDIEIMKFVKERLNEETEILRKKGFSAAPMTLLKKSDFKNNEFQKNVQKKFQELFKDPAISDIVVSFNLDYNNTPSAHAILIQLKHARVYDANSGVYHYKSKKDLLNDLKMTQQKGCTEVGFRPFKFAREEK